MTQRIDEEGGPLEPDVCPVCHNRSAFYRPTTDAFIHRWCLAYLMGRIDGMESAAGDMRRELKRLRTQDKRRL